MCYVFVTHKIRATMDLLPMADEVRVVLASCDHSLAEIWRDVLIFASREFQHGPDFNVHQCINHVLNFKHMFSFIDFSRIRP